jgi:hypothetical protein
MNGKLEADCYTLPVQVAVIKPVRAPVLQENLVQPRVLVAKSGDHARRYVGPPESLVLNKC